MKITLDWLKEHLEGDFTVNDVVATLNRIGHEVEGVENPAEKLAGFRVAKVLTAERHPQADKLQVLSVDAGDEHDQKMLRLFTMTQRRLRVKVMGVVMPSPVVVAMEKLG